MANGTGQIIPTYSPIYPNHIQEAEGGVLNAAANKTIAAQQQASDAAKSLGAGQKGSSRRRKSKTRRHRKVKKGGAASLNANFPLLPSAGSMKGVPSSLDNHIRLVDMKNQFAANAAGDKLLNATPYQVAGTKRHRKAKNGRSRHRIHRGRYS
jgi:hypothetical protein